MARKRRLQYSTHMHVKSITRLHKVIDVRFKLHARQTSATRQRRTLVQDVQVMILRHELSVEYQEPSLPQPEVIPAI